MNDVKKRLTDFMFTNIPSVHNNQIEVLESELSTVILGAPLEGNSNHLNTVFGGISTTVAILSALSLIYINVSINNSENKIMIRKHCMQHQYPINGYFTSRSVIESIDHLTNLKKSLARKKMGRIDVKSTLWCNHQQVASFEGNFVVMSI